jgi:hypothetical protein
MTDAQLEKLVAAMRALPVAERLKVAKRVLECLPPKELVRIMMETPLLPGLLPAIESRLKTPLRPTDLTGPQDALDTSIAAPAADTALSMLGLFADEPELVDEVCRRAYEDRATAQPRQIDE